MPLSDKLLEAQFKLTCPNCGHTQLRKGAWIKTVRGYTCTECRCFTPLTYNAKVALFEERKLRD